MDTKDLKQAVKGEKISIPGKDMRTHVTKTIWASRIEKAAWFVGILASVFGGYQYKEVQEANDPAHRVELPMNVAADLRTEIAVIKSQVSGVIENQKESKSDILNAIEDSRNFIDQKYETRIKNMGDRIVKLIEDSSSNGTKISVLESDMKLLKDQRAPQKASN